MLRRWTVSFNLSVLLLHPFYTLYFAVCYTCEYSCFEYSCLQLLWIWVWDTVTEPARGLSTHFASESVRSLRSGRVWRVRVSGKTIRSAYKYRPGQFDLLLCRGSASGRVREVAETTTAAEMTRVSYRSDKLAFPESDTRPLLSFNECIDLPIRELGGEQLSPPLVQ